MLTRDCQQLTRKPLLMRTFTRIKSKLTGTANMVLRPTQASGWKACDSQNKTPRAGCQIGMPLPVGRLRNMRSSKNKSPRLARLFLRGPHGYTHLDASAPAPTSLLNQSSSSLLSLFLICREGSPLTVTVPTICQVLPTRELMKPGYSYLGSICSEAKTMT